MQKLFAGLLIVASALFLSASALKVDCEFKTSNGWDVLGSPYGCFITNMAVTDKQQVTGASGSHLYGNTNNEVKVFNIYGGVCNILPSGFGTVFKNLEGLTVWNAALQTISSEDFKEFSGLREIYIYANQIVYLESNLFEFNPKMEFIHFQNNKIKYIGSNFFNQLPKLKFADFHSNVCIDDDAKDAAKLESLRKQIDSKCAYGGSEVAVGSNKATLQLIETLQFRVYLLQLQVLTFQGIKGCSLV